MSGLQGNHEREDRMECLRCGNKDISFFYEGHRGLYCRRCVRFKRILLEEEPESFEYEVGHGVDEYSFSYQLTKDQLIASEKCLDGLKRGDILLHCICGAGKTEISVQSISHYLSEGLKVAYAIARKEVVIELQRRFSRIFTNARVTAVYGGHHEDLAGDLIVCTCHQLYRYYRTFDLLILDEVDAFPLKGNETLMNISINSCKGRIIFSTATVDDVLMKILNKRTYEKVELFVRPSYRPMVMPRIIILFPFLSYICLFILMLNIKRQCIIFVSSRRTCIGLYRILSKLISCTYVYSDLDEREANIRSFREKKFQFIISTSVLERGVTIKDIDVIILDHSAVFDQSSLIQMLGRINRGIGDDNGQAFIITDRYDSRIRNTIKYLERANECL